MIEAIETQADSHLPSGSLATVFESALNQYLREAKIGAGRYQSFERSY